MRKKIVLPDEEDRDGELANLSLSALGPEKALAIIAKAIEKGGNPERFDKLLDELLGTGLSERDEAAEEAFENCNRAKD